MSKFNKQQNENAELRKISKNTETKKDININNNNKKMNLNFIEEFECFKIINNGNGRKKANRAINQRIK